MGAPDCSYSCFLATNESSACLSFSLDVCNAAYASLYMIHGIFSSMMFTYEGTMDKAQVQQTVC